MWSLEIFITLCSAPVIHCSFSCVLPFQGSCEVVLCFGAWWLWLCWRLFVLVSDRNGPPAFYLFSPWCCRTTSDAGGDLCGLQEMR